MSHSNFKELLGSAHIIMHISLSKQCHYNALAPHYNPPRNPEPANSCPPVCALPLVASGDTSLPSLIVTDSEHVLPHCCCHFHPQYVVPHHDFLCC